MDACTTPAGVPPSSGRAGPASREQPVAQIAKDLGISESCLRRWMAQDDVDERPQGRACRPSERAELVRLRRENRVQEMEIEILKRASRLLRPGERAPKIGFRLVQSSPPTASTSRWPAGS